MKRLVRMLEGPVGACDDDQLTGVFGRRREQAELRIRAPQLAALYDQAECQEGQPHDGRQPGQQQSE